MPDLDKIRTEIALTATRYGHIEFENKLKALVIKRLQPFIQGPRVLSLGYAMDVWAEAAIAQGASRIEIIEGVEEHVEHARSRYGDDNRIAVHHMLFEEFKPEQRFDTVIAGSVIEHLFDAQCLLAEIKNWLAPGGRVIVTTPNIRSLHRRLGALMGVDSITEWNAQAVDTHVHQTYDKYSLRDEMVRAGYRVTYINGCFLKPLSSPQMMDWSDEMLEALLHLGDELGDYAKELVAVCEL